MSARTLLRPLVLCAALVAQPAGAIPILGTFSGVARGELNNFDGTATPFAEPVASAGGLFQDFDLATFDPARIDTELSSAAFSDNIRSYRALISFDTLTFEGFPSQVPEGATRGLFSLGLALLAFASRQRKDEKRRITL